MAARRLGLDLPDPGPVKDRDRLKLVSKRLARMGAAPLLTPGEIDALDDVEADRWCRIEADRLAVIVRVQIEAQHRTTAAPKRRKSDDPQG